MDKEHRIVFYMLTIDIVCVTSSVLFRSNFLSLVFFISLYNLKLL